METPHFTSTVIAPLLCQNISWNPSLPSSYFHHWEHFLAHFHHRRRKRSSLELEATDIGPAQWTPPTSSLEVILIKNYHYIFLYYFCFTLFTFYCFSLVFISVYFCLPHWTATMDSRFLSRCSSAQARVKTLATWIYTMVEIYNACVCSKFLLIVIYSLLYWSNTQDAIYDGITAT